MQPLFEVALSRSWHWGIAIVSAPGAAVPEALDKSLVTGSHEALVIKVRHAHDVDVEVFDGDWDWAIATIRVRSLTDFEDTAEPPIYEGLLRLPEGRLVIGDADSEVTLNDLADQTRVRVHAAGESACGATEVLIDLAPMTQ